MLEEKAQNLIGAESALGRRANSPLYTRQTHDVRCGARIIGFI